MNYLPEMTLQKVLLIQACLRKMQVAYPFAGEDLSLSQIRTREAKIEI